MSRIHAMDGEVPAGPGLFEVNGHDPQEKLITNVRRVAGTERTPGSLLISISAGLWAKAAFAIEILGEGLATITIWDADAETKITWRDPDTKEMRTTVMPGRGIQTFQTLGVLKLEATGEPYHEVKFGYVLLGMKK